MGRCRRNADTFTRRELYQLSEVCGVEHYGFEIYKYEKKDSDSDIGESEKWQLILII